MGRMKDNSLRNKLRNGDICLGSWITLGAPAVAEILALSGYEWLVIDLEHSSLSLTQAEDLIRIIDILNVSPLVRLTSNDPNQIKRVMDAGAHGIVVPNVKTLEDAQKAVSSTRYAPQGSRGVGLARAQKYGPGFDDYLNWQKDGPLVIVQIEDQSALPNLCNIFGASGVDGFIIGPYDLSCSMGIPGQFDHQDFINTKKKILNAGIEAGCPAGLHIVEPDTESLLRCIDEGYKLIAYSVDIRMIDVSARAAIKIAKK